MGEFFEIKQGDQDTNARLGEMRTMRGSVPTPAYVPYGTRESGQPFSAGELRFWGAGMVMASAYDLSLKPGDALIAKAGGVHEYLGASTPVFSDSGSPQIRALAAGDPLKPHAVTVGSAGFVFRAGSDSRLRLLSPEQSVQIQLNLGSDIVLALSPLTMVSDRISAAKKTAALSSDWLNRSVRQLEKSQVGDRAPILFAAFSCGSHPELLDDFFSQAGIQRAAGLYVDWSSWSRHASAYRDALSARGLLERPRHAGGIRSPKDVIRAVGEGVDSFDAAFPHELASSGRLLVSENVMDGYSVLELALGNMPQPSRPIDASCDCYTCLNFSRSELASSWKQDRPQAARLSAMHNYKYVFNLMSRVRRAVQYGSFGGMLKEFRQVREQ